MKERSLMSELIDVLSQDRVLCVVRAQQVPDPAGLASTLAGAGIRLVEFTFTIPGVLDVIREAAQAPDAVIGAGTVLTPKQAEDAIAAGARYLLTPDLRPEVAAVAREAGIPFILGAFTPTEVSRAVELGSAAVKIFPAHIVGPGYVKDLHGPFPDVRLIATGGVNQAVAKDYLDCGALAVGAGTDVVPPGLVEAGDHAAIAERAAAFVKHMKLPHLK
jgi:2-dehydro-3-deoxyphosphogluconate aldolase/(4S)-4-hydroxy-2-oxoglutarate aldolase